MSLCPLRACFLDRPGFLLYLCVFLTVRTSTGCQALSPESRYCCLSLYVRLSMNSSSPPPANRPCSPCFPKASAKVSTLCGTAKLYTKFFQKKCSKTFKRPAFDGIRPQLLCLSGTFRAENSHWGNGWHCSPSQSPSRPFSPPVSAQNH